MEGGEEASREHGLTTEFGVFCGGTYQVVREVSD